MEESDFFNNLRVFDDDLDEDLLKYPKYCLLLDKPFNNVRRIDLLKNEDFINCISHLQKHHPHRYFTDSARFKIDLTQSGEYHSIIRQMNYLFFVEFEVKNNIVYITVHMLNAPIEVRTSYFSYTYHKTFTVELKQERSFVKEKAVRHKGMGYIYTLEFNVSDLSIIGDITQTEVFISIENYITCECDIIRKCSDGADIYRCGWRCFKCNLSFSLTRCNADMEVYDCDTWDCRPKLQKHTHFFCPRQSTCYVCHKNMYEKSFTLHYQKHHQDITYQIGEDILIQATPGRYCLLRYSANTILVMRYHLDSEELFLAIRSPWLRFMYPDQGEYNCSVTVSTCEQIETFQLYPLPYEYDDWRLSVGKWIFKKWSTNTEFTVVVDIQRIPPSYESDVGTD